MEQNKNIDNENTKTAHFYVRHNFMQFILILSLVFQCTIFFNVFFQSLSMLFMHYDLRIEVLALFGTPSMHIIEYNWHCKYRFASEHTQHMKFNSDSRLFHLIRVIWHLRQ
jgi:hypothetical protein